MKKYIYGLEVFLILLLASCTSNNHAYAPLEGDIIFHISTSAQSMAIQHATGSPYSHMGIVFLKQGRPYVFEAISTTKYTPLSAWISRGKKGHYVVKRLKTPLTVQQIEILKKEASKLAGKSYDLAFEWSDSRIYCSELVWKLYKRALGVELGKLQFLSEFNLDDPLVKTKLKERYGNHIPFKETVISPVAVLRSELLVTVVE